MPLFRSQFHLPHPGGVEHVAQEKAATDERKCLKRARAQECAECQRHGASLLDDDDEDDDGTEDDEEDLEVLQSIPDVFLRSGDGAWLSGVGCTASAMDKEGAARK